MKDLFDTKKIKGWVTIWAIEGDKRSKVYDDHNALTADAKEILTQLLAGQAWGINKISAVKASSTLADTPSLAFTFPTTDSVEFTGLFDEASFNDTLDEIQLWSNGGKKFSTVTGLAVFKSNLLKLQITWKLTIQ